MIIKLRVAHCFVLIGELAGSLEHLNPYPISNLDCLKSGIGVLKRVLTLTVQQQLSSDFDWHQSC